MNLPKSVNALFWREFHTIVVLIAILDQETDEDRRFKRKYRDIHVVVVLSPYIIGELIFFQETGRGTWGIQITPPEQPSPQPPPPPPLPPHTI